MKCLVPDPPNGSVWFSTWWRYHCWSYLPIVWELQKHGSNTKNMKWVDAAWTLTEWLIALRSVKGLKLSSWFKCNGDRNASRTASVVYMQGGVQSTFIRVESFWVLLELLGRMHSEKHEVTPLNLFITLKGIQLFCYTERSFFQLKSRCISKSQFFNKNMHTIGSEFALLFGFFS